MRVLWCSPIGPSRSAPSLIRRRRHQLTPSHSVGSGNKATSHAVKISTKTVEVVGELAAHFGDTVGKKLGIQSAQGCSPVGPSFNCLTSFFTHSIFVWETADRDPRSNQPLVDCIQHARRLGHDRVRPFPPLFVIKD